MSRATIIAPGISYRWTENGAAPSADSFLLADFAASRVKGKVCDLCGGAGLLSVLLCVKEKGESYVCADIDSSAVEMCRDNAVSAGFGDKITACVCDLKNINEYLSPESFDSVVCNPPYHEIGGRLSQVRACARSETECSLEQVCFSAASVLKNGRRFFVCMKASRLADLICCMRNAKIEPKRLRFVSHSVGRAPFLVLCEGIKGASPSIELCAPLVLYEEDGKPTAESNRIYYGIGEKQDGRTLE